MSRWASNYISQLSRGYTVQFRPQGSSMTGRVESGQLCTVEPSKVIQSGDVVLCSVKGSHYLHLVKSVKNGRYLIGNNRGGINGWIGLAAIYGKLTEVSP